MTELSLTAEEWVADLRSELSEDVYFGPILRILCDSEACAPPSSAAAEERKLWVRAKRYQLREGLLFLKEDAGRQQPSETTSNGILPGRLCIPASMTKRL
jgi:hypothetical protein